MNIIELRKGGVYFSAWFFDQNLSITSIRTYIYERFDEKHGHMFIDAESHLEISADKNDVEACYICFPESKIRGILDLKNLIKWLQEEHSPRLVGKSFQYVAL
jgi:hypothetical protein